LARWIPVATVVVLLGAGMLAAASSQISFGHRGPLIAPSLGRDDRPTGVPESLPPAPSTAVEDKPWTLPAWLGTVVAAICASAAVALLLMLLWLALRDRLAERTRVPEVADPEEVRRQARERVRAAVDEGLSDLDVDDGDPRRAVIACWARLEAAAAAAGTPREPGDTSTELVHRLLTEHAVSAPVLDGFAAVYREARFAAHAVDPAMRDQARAALRQIRDELVAGVGS
jgi:hypothetical protein